MRFDSHKLRVNDHRREHIYSVNFPVSYINAGKMLSPHHNESIFFLFYFFIALIICSLVLKFSVQHTQALNQKKSEKKNDSVS